MQVVAGRLRSDGVARFARCSPPAGGRRPSGHCLLRSCLRSLRSSVV